MSEVESRLISQESCQFTNAVTLSVPAELLCDFTKQLKSENVKKCCETFKQLSFALQMCESNVTKARLSQSTLENILSKGRDDTSDWESRLVELTNGLEGLEAELPGARNKKHQSNQIEQTAKLINNFSSISNAKVRLTELKKKNQDLNAKSQATLKALSFKSKQLSSIVHGISEASSSLIAFNTPPEIEMEEESIDFLGV
eukprot:TRINITY_DN1504_c0_g1_i1.p1 TRINITY_DN1504_c0_g1~~TRINITY_DN1504_c0_g1_i1.p1  ORF type:complete len:201 (-),score=45.81 TRINITY_DN1504_c0_g1_i1:718-1320(-)